MRAGAKPALVVASLTLALLSNRQLPADEPRPLAAVLPTQGALAEPTRKVVTIEFRERLRRHGYRLARQRDVRAAAEQSRIPVLVNVMPPPAWRAFFNDYVPTALEIMEERRPPNTIALAIVGNEGVVVAFAEQTLQAVGPQVLH